MSNFYYKPKNLKDALLFWVFISEVLIVISWLVLTFKDGI